MQSLMEVRLHKLKVQYRHRATLGHTTMKLLDDRHRITNTDMVSHSVTCRPKDLNFGTIDNWARKFFIIELLGSL